jgi:hypothetical protein
LVPDVELSGEGGGKPPHSKMIAPRTHRDKGMLYRIARAVRQSGDWRSQES